MAPKEHTPRVALSVMMFFVVLTFISALAGCDSAEQPAGPAEPLTTVDPPDEDSQDLRHVAEFDDFTFHLSATRADFLHDSLAQRYEVDAGPDHAMLNLVIRKKRSGGQAETVVSEVSAEYENLIGQVKTVEMRSVEADGYVSYIGTLDASEQRTFNLTIEAQPEGADEPFQMDFELELAW